LRLRQALDAVATALAAPNVADLVAAESALSHALAEIASIHLVDRGDRHALAAEVIRARAALQRCRVLGAMAVDATRATLLAQGRGDTYGRRGAAHAASDAPRGDFSSRI
jgi:hypothetical protein